MSKKNPGSSSPRQSLLPKITFNDESGTVSIRRVPVGQMSSQVKPRVDSNSYFRSRTQAVVGNHYSDAQITMDYARFIGTSICEYAKAIGHRLVGNPIISILIAVAGFLVFQEWWGVPLMMMVVSFLYTIAIIFFTSIITMLVRTRTSLAWGLMLLITYIAATVTGNTWYLYVYAVILVLPLVLRLVDVFVKVPNIETLRGKSFIVGDIDHFIDSRAAWRTRHSNRLVRLPRT